MYWGGFKICGGSPERGAKDNNPALINQNAFFEWPYSAFLIYGRAARYTGERRDMVIVLPPRVFLPCASLFVAELKLWPSLCGFA
jgi:hypothetical protein